MALDPSKSGESSSAESPRSARAREFPSDHSVSKGQQASKRYVYSTWADGKERDLCEHAVATLPERVPIAGRTGLAVARWSIVDTRDDRVLICNRLHDGDCAWPWDVQAG